MQNDYTSPAITEVASLHEITLQDNKGDSHKPDGYKYHGIVLTSY